CIWPVPDFQPQRLRVFFLEKTGYFAASLEFQRDDTVSRGDACAGLNQGLQQLLTRQAGCYAVKAGAGISAKVVISMTPHALRRLVAEKDISPAVDVAFG